MSSYLKVDWVTFKYETFLLIFLRLMKMVTKQRLQLFVQTTTVRK